MESAKGKGKGCLVAVLIVVAIVVAGVAGLIFWFMQASNVTEYAFGEDIVPAFSSVVEGRKCVSVATGIDNGVSYKTYSYTAKEGDMTSDDAWKDMDVYGTELINNHGFYITDYDDYFIELAKESSDAGKIVIVSMFWSDETHRFEVDIRKGEGTVTSTEDTTE